MKRYTGSGRCLQSHGQYDPHNRQSPHRCRCLHTEHHDEPQHQCRCGTTWKETP